MSSNRQTKPQAKLYVMLSFTLALISFILMFSDPSQAGKPTTIWVTNLFDNYDNPPQGSLRWALNESNTRPGKDIIKFKVSGTIPVQGNLFFHDQSGVVLDGFSAPNPGIVLYIMGGGQLLVMSSNNIIQGLTIIGYDLDSWGINLWGYPDVIAQNNLIEGNKITDCGRAVEIYGASKNVIRNNVLVGNHIGVFFDGTSTGNNENVIEDNVIGNSGSWGIGLGQGFGNIIRGNYIGLDRNGTPLPNEWHGIEISGYAEPVPTTGNNTVGPGNVIAFNKQNGIMDYVTGNTFTKNSIFDNLWLGILVGVAPNWGLEPPEIVSTNPIAGTAPSNSTVEIFFDGGWQGRFFIGSVRADNSGNFTSAFTLSGLAGNVTATATDQPGNTSMFSTPSPIPPTP